MAAGDKVYIADKETLDSISFKIGTNTDDSSKLSLFGFLAWIKSHWTATRAAKLDNLDMPITSISSAIDFSKNYKIITNTVSIGTTINITLPPNKRILGILCVRYNESYNTTLIANGVKVSKIVIGGVTVFNDKYYVDSSDYSANAGLQFGLAYPFFGNGSGPGIPYSGPLPSEISCDFISSHNDYIECFNLHNTGSYNTGAGRILVVYTDI